MKCTNAIKKNDIKNIRKYCSSEKIKDKVCESKINDQNYNILKLNECIDNVKSIKLKNKRLPVNIIKKIPKMKNLNSIFLEYQESKFPTTSFQLRKVLRNLPEKLESVSINGVYFMPLMKSSIYINTSSDNSSLKKLNIRNSFIKSIEFSEKVKQSLIDLKLPSNSIVNIDLDGFKNLKLVDISNNMIKKLKVSSSVVKLIAEGNYIDSIQIDDNSNLEMLNLSRNSFYDSDGIDLRKLHKLKKIEANHSFINEIFLPNIVEEADLSFNDITSFDVPNNLKKLNIAYNKIEKIDTKNIEELNIDYNNLHEIKIGKDLKKLSAKSNKLRYIELTNIESLSNVEFANLSENSIRFLKLGNKIKKLDASHNDIIEIECDDCNLDFLNLSSNKLSELPKLNAKYLDIRSNYIKELDLSNFPITETLLADNNEIFKIDVKEIPKSLKKISIKNNNLKEIPDELENKIEPINYI